jgi:hypothetical protein
MELDTIFKIILQKKKILQILQDRGTDPVFPSEEKQLLMLKFIFSQISGI